MKKYTSICNNQGEILESKEENYKPKAEFGKGRRFSKVFHTTDIVFKIPTEYQLWFFIERHLELGTNRLVLHSTSTKKNDVITKQYMIDNWMPRTTLERVLKSFIKNNILNTLTTEKGVFMGYFLNPIYAFNGRYIETIPYELFKSKELHDFMSKTGIQQVSSLYNDNEFCD